MNETVATPDFTVTFSLSDVAFDGPGCVNVPMSNTYTKTGAEPGRTSARLELHANQDGASNSIQTTLVAMGSHPATATTSDPWKMCPERVDLDHGPLVISGTLTSSVIGGATTEAVVPLSTIALRPNPVALTRPRDKLTDSFLRSIEITGTATATTLTKGNVPAGGVLTLQLKKPGSKSWVSGLTSRVDAYGDYLFQLTPTRKYPKGTRYRVSVNECGWCANAVSPVGRI
jgi:hypothetical protein